MIYAWPDGWNLGEKLNEMTKRKDGTQPGR